MRATGEGLRPRSRRPGFAVLLVLALAALGCRVGQEGGQVTAKVHARNQALAVELETQRVENDALRAQLLGYVPWEGTVQVGRVGGVHGLVPYARVCPQGEAVIGFAGRVGGVIDALAPLCAPLDRSGLLGVVEGSPVETELRQAGGTGGGPFRSVCDPGSHVVGLKGRVGSAIDAVEPMCEDTSWVGVSPAPPGAAAGRPRPVKVLPKVGGGGGAPFESRCPAGWVVVGISGRCVDLGHSLSLHCVRLPGASAADSLYPAR